jgi:Kef-type K+ transport system membrane component KefB
MEPQPFAVPVLVWVSAAAALAPWLAERMPFLRLPVIALELLLGILLGPHGLGIATVSASLPYLSKMGMATLFFLAGMEVDLRRLRGTPLRRGIASWLLSLLLAGGIAHAMFAAGWLSGWVIVAMALSTTALGVISPVLRDTGLADTPLGLCATACGFVGEIGPILIASVLFAASGGELRQGGLTLLFVLLAVGLCWASVRVHPPPGVIGLLARSMNRSGQWPIRLCLLLLGVLVVLAQALGLDLALGAFAAGLAVGLATRDSPNDVLHHKLDAIGFGFLVPVFFIASGMQLDMRILLAHPASIALVAVLALALLAARALPALVFASLFTRREVVALGFYSATSLSLIVAFTSAATELGRMPADEAVALVAAGLVSVLAYPLVAERILGRRATRTEGALPARDAL